MYQALEKSVQGPEPRPVPEDRERSAGTWGEHTRVHFSAPVHCPFVSIWRLEAAWCDHNSGEINFEGNNNQATGMKKPVNKHKKITTKPGGRTEKWKFMNQWIKWEIQEMEAKRKEEKTKERMKSRVKQKKSEKKGGKLITGEGMPM